jgi:hypothetical protein
MRSAVIRPYPVRVEVINPEFRQADVYSDTEKIGEAPEKIDLFLDVSTPYQILFDPGVSLHEKIMRSQFHTPQL